MSIKHPKFRAGLKIVTLIIFGLVIFNAIGDYQAHEGSVRRLSALKEIRSVSLEDSVEVLKMVKR